jgi:hypothetical protein
MPLDSSRLRPPAIRHTVSSRVRLRIAPGVDALIVRVLTARVPPPNVGQFNVLIRGELDELRAQPGLVYVKLARRLDRRGGEEVVLFEEWRTPADLWKWTGGRLSRPRLLPGTEELVDDLLIQHYEALDLDPFDLHLTEITSVTYPPNLLERQVEARPDDENDAPSGRPQADR